MDAKCWRSAGQIVGVTLALEDMSREAPAAEHLNGNLLISCPVKTIKETIIPKRAHLLN